MNSIPSQFPFFAGLSIISVILAVSIYFLNKFHPEFIHPDIWHILIFFMVTMSISHLVASLGLRKVADFHIYYFGSMGIRFFLSLIFIFISLFLTREKHVLFVANFFILYLVYTSFEIYLLICNLRADSKKDGSAY